MNNKNDGQKHRIDMEKRINNNLSKVVVSGGLHVAQWHNAKYNVSHWTSIMATMCIHDCTAEEAIRDVIADPSIPTAKWFRDAINNLSEKQAECLCKKLMVHTIQLVLKARPGRNGPVMIAIDKYKRPRYDDNNMAHLIYSKWDHGTKRFEAYATLQVVGEEKESGMNIILDGVKFTRDTENEEFVRRFVHILTNIEFR